MLAGHPPFTGSTPQAVSARHQFETPPPIEVVRRGLPPGVRALLERALSKTAADRFQDATSLRTALATLPQTIISPRVRHLRRFMVGTAAATLGIIILGAFGWHTINTDVAEQALAVIPFTAEGVSSRALCGTECSTLIDDALSQWVDFPKIDQMRIRNAVAIHGAPKVLSEAERMARSLGAGRFISGMVYQQGNTLRVNAFLNQLTWLKSRTLAQSSISIRIDDTTAATAQRVATDLNKMARELFTGLTASELPPEQSIYARNLAAVRLKLRGDSAFGAWDIENARGFYREALTIDPEYAQARLAMAQFASWMKRPETEWRDDAIAAASRPEGLTVSQRLQAQALSALGSGDYPAACEGYRGLVARDSMDFGAWFGLGDCLARDSAIVVSEESVSGVAWRSSYADALRSFDRALSLLPGMNRLFTGPALSALLDRYFVASNQLRFGRALSDPTKVYLAFPSIAADTIAFLPRPAQGILDGDWPAEHPLEAIALNRRALLKVTSRWITTYPRDPAVWRAHALALEMLNAISGADPTASALYAIRAARGRALGAASSLDLAATQVRLFIKADSLNAALSLADSLLSQSLPSNSDDFVLLAGLAALRGDKERAAAFARRGARSFEFGSSDGEVLAIDSLLKADAAELLIRAVAHAPSEQLRALKHQIISRTGGTHPSSRELTIRRALLDRATLFAFPYLGTPDGTGPLYLIEQAIARKDTSAARAGFDLLASARSGQRTGDRGIDGALLESRLRHQIGDTVEARLILQDLRRNLNTLGQSLLSDPAQATSLNVMLGNPFVP
jgi:tetratricopeptide (TPR) repeat protein